jgi:hypothetical protein
VGPYPPLGNASVDNRCRSKTPSGPVVEFNGTLTEQSPPGHWLEVLGASRVNYTVINIGAAHAGRGHGRAYSCDCACFMCLRSSCDPFFASPPPGQVPTSASSTTAARARWARSTASTSSRGPPRCRRASRTSCWLLQRGLGSIPTASRTSRRSRTAAGEGEGPGPGVVLCCRRRRRWAHWHRPTASDLIVVNFGLGWD